MLYTKCCKHCHKTYESAARHQRFCSPECQKKHSKLTRKRRREYAKNAREKIIGVQAHKLAVLVATFHFEKECVVSGATENLEVHHKDGQPLNNLPDNLMWIEKDLHVKLHSYAKKSVENGDPTPEQLMEASTEYPKVWQSKCAEEKSEELS